MSYTNNWTQVIRQLLDEGHTKEELMKLSNSELEKLHDEYKDKDDEASQKEAKMIKDILDARGDDKEEKLEEMNYGGGGRSKGATNAIIRANQRVNEKMKAKEPKPEPKPEKKEDIKEENEQLLLMIDVLCEMVGVDIETLVEETRKEMENLAHAYGWDQKSPEGATGANERIARVRANMKRLGKRNTRDAIPAGMKTALDIELAGDDVHERSAKKGGGVVKDPKAFARTQRSIEKIGDDVQLRDFAKVTLPKKNPKKVNESKIKETVKKVIKKGKAINRWANMKSSKLDPDHLEKGMSREKP